MANFTSAHTGNEIDLSIASGSTTTGVIKDFNTLSGSSTSTINVGGAINTLSHITASGNISASGTIFASKFESAGTSGETISFNDNLNITGNITASGNISASGGLSIRTNSSFDSQLVVGTQLSVNGISNLNGDVNLGNALTDDVNVKGHMTASGNISSSGTVTAAAAVLTTVDINGGTINGITDLAVADGGTGVSTLTDGGVLLGNGTGGIVAMAVLTDGQMIVGDGTTDPVAESGATLRTSIGVGAANNVIFNNITASGNISASGTLDVTGNVNFDGDLDVDGTTNLDVVDIDGAVNMATTLTVVQNTSLGGHPSRTHTFIGAITSSGAISSSANINASSYTLDNLPVLQTDSGVLTLGFGFSTSKINLGRVNQPTPIFTFGSITSSNNISASGTIEANQFDVDGRQAITYNSGYRFGFANDEPIQIGKSANPISLIGHITASGNISASGIITAEGLEISDDATITDNLFVGNNLYMQDTLGDIVFSEGGGGTNQDFVIGVREGGVRINAGDGNPTAVAHLNVSSSGGTATANARVGIGTETPDEMLTVGGNISASGGFFVSSSGNTMINSDLTGSMATHLGAFSVNYGNEARLSGSLTATGDSYGDIVKIGTTTGMTAGRVHTFGSDGLTWTQGANIGAISSSLCGIALGTNSAIDGVLLRGFVKLGSAHDTLVVGQKVYNEASGRVAVAPGADSGDVVRVLGYCIGKTSHIYFNPSNDWIEIA